MTDVPPDNAILVMLQSIKDDQSNATDRFDKHLSKLDDRFNELGKIVVGWDRCSSNRAECRRGNEVKFDELFSRLRSIENIGTTFEAQRSEFVNGSALSDAKDDMLIKAKENDNVIYERLFSIEKKIDTWDTRFRVWDFTWNNVKGNKFLFTTYLGGIAVLVGVYSGRADDVFKLTQEFGSHAVIIGVVVALIIILALVVIVWGILNRKRLMLMLSS